jgi:class 3 adenylate cyclase
MSFGQLGAVIIRENVSSGDGSLEIMIPGHRINSIFLVVRINSFNEITEALKSQIPEFLNKIIGIVHQCAEKWDGWANRNECDKYLITWKLPDTEHSSDNEKNEQLLEQKTEMADKALISAVKMVSEMRRAVQFATYFRRPALYAKFSQTLRPHLTFGLHMGWTIEGAIGSESKIDAGYLSPHCQIAYRIENLCETYKM